MGSSNQIHTEFQLAIENDKGTRGQDNSEFRIRNSELTTSNSSLLGLSLEELTAWVQQQGQPAYRGRQLHEWIYQKGVRSLAEISVSDRTPF